MFLQHFTAQALHTLDFWSTLLKGPCDAAIYKTSNLVKSVCVSLQPQFPMASEWIRSAWVSKRHAKRKGKKKSSSRASLEQEAHTRITSDQYKSTMCIKCHVTTRVNWDQTLGDVWAVQSQAERKTVASLMMDTVAKKTGSRTRSCGILRRKHSRMKWTGGGGGGGVTKNFVSAT